MAVLESKLIIGASDETGAAFASVMARINEMSAKIAAVNKGFTPPPSFTGHPVRRWPLPRPRHRSPPLFRAVS
jgi:hypothetical protein